MFKEADCIIEKFEKVISKPIIPLNKDNISVGVDVGTAYIVIAVLDEYKVPVAGAYRFAQVVKDGIVVDYVGTVNIIKKLKKEVEEKIDCELKYTAIAIPPGTNINDTRYIKNAVEGAGFEVTNIVDEPTAANAVLNIKDGAIVDIGGGTTGIAIFKGGEVIHIVDEATGGTQCTLVLAGTYKIKFEEAEELKKNVERKIETSSVLVPVAEKIGMIVKKNIEGYFVNSIFLVGGTSCMHNIEQIIEKVTGIKTYKPKNPIFVTPLGIAMNCK